MNSSTNIPLLTNSPTPQAIQPSAEEIQKFSALVERGQKVKAIRYFYKIKGRKMKVLHRLVLSMGQRVVPSLHLDTIIRECKIELGFDVVEPIDADVLRDAMFDDISVEALMSYFLVMPGRVYVVIGVGLFASAVALFKLRI